MRLSPILLTSQYYVNNVRPKNGRKPTRQPFPFQNILPISLRDHVSGKGNKQQNVACLQEMSVLFACLKANDFNQAMCPKEIQSFKGCHKNFLDTQKLKKVQEREGVLVPGEKDLSPKQLNQLLRKYPQPN
ncbi:small ribosomal subunit protein mS37-like [Penaeus indicus]|uniref:small ribosomal subunit protein mS37-like n=1 Tax=Penaeus indicus TaxID=29960 RepID=UPI00300CA396